MWGLLEKTKELAANIEGQLNESVGAEGGGPSAPSSGGAPALDDDALNDAWNDDFDDDDFDNQPRKVAVPPVAPPIATPTIVEEEEEPSSNNAGGGWDESVNFEEDEELLVEPGTPKQPEPIPQEAMESPLADAALQPPVFSPPVAVPEPPLVVEAPEPAPEPEPEPVAPEPVPVPEPVAPEPEIPEPAVVEEPESPPPEAEAPATESSKESSPVVVEKQDAGWENDLYDDDDDDDDDDDEEEDEQPPVPMASVPPATISIPSNESTAAAATNTVDSAAAAAAREELKQAYELQLAQMKSTLHQVQQQLEQREGQVAQKAQQLAALEQAHDAETTDLKQKVKDTKEEAKRRIAQARQRADAATGSQSEDLAAKDETIEALRQEGQSLAMKQAEMVKAVRAAKFETRDLTASLEEQVGKTTKATDKVASLEAELKRVKEDLAAARRGESMSHKLEQDLVTLQEDADRKEAANLSLQQQNKELKATVKELKKDMELSQKGLLLDSKRESKRLNKEHTDMVGDLEEKLRATERQASVREDGLRKEVTELRTRWQDAVRRADALSMDVQNSTAPLLRQLESMERQTRARAAAWAELETKLRSDLEDNIIDNEKLTKERNDFKSNVNRMTRMSKDRDEELMQGKSTIQDYKMKLDKQEVQIETMEREGKKMKEEWEKVERLANEGVSKVRSDMMKTVLESEERHQAQVKSIENELKEERKKRSLLEQQVEGLLENAGMMMVPTPSMSATAPVMPKSTQKKLRPSEGQADILAGALGGFGSDDDEEDDDDDDDNLDWDQVDQDEAVQQQQAAAAQNVSSFAAMEQLSSRLKEAKVELEALRQSLSSSERVRESLLAELGETRVAKEKLPLFEQKVQELGLENRELQMEIYSLREDISEIRSLYKGQLNALIEEKAANLTSEAGNERSRMSSTYPTDDDFFDDAPSAPPSAPASGNNEPASLASPPTPPPPADSAALASPVMATPDGPTNTLDASANRD